MLQTEFDKHDVAKIKQALEGDDAQLAQVLVEYHPSEIAIFFEHLTKEEQERIVNLLPSEVASEAISEMDEEQHPAELLLQLEPEKRKEIIEEFDYDDATDIIAQLDIEEQEEILEDLDLVDAAAIRNLLTYPEDSAGGLMNSSFISVNIHQYKTDAINEIIRQSEDMEEFYTIYVVDEQKKLVGIVSIKDIIKSRADVKIADLIKTDFKYVRADADQEEVAKIISQYNLTSLPVVDGINHLLGQITVDDVIDVLEEENTEDILRISGVSEDEELSGSWKPAVKSRLPWLIINLATAFLAASVPRHFEKTIEQLAVLSAYMTIIAGMGGNTATQALAVTVRRISLNQLSDKQAWNTIKKEILVGFINGAVNGIIVCIVALLLDNNPMLGLVLFLAMVGNMIVAGIAGSGIPLLLKRLGIDPAIASSIIITTFTDVFGFLLPLGLASKLLL
ncbi:magnesium transporter [Arachidicoccus ginsenosidimutans]|uniref:magnesium transporter n=1 Tax=Arachidicoccus sp. BS20 TaxID=1850526 RepID=UPI0007F09E34|nr:magnesium transporter [Arachidicoccus sp. BS20]ANI88240.1 magnesium transporter [Arachidicoccus sp. BS20]